MPLLEFSRPKDADLSVVILNWNAREYLVACLNSIICQEWRHTVEIIVVDNDSRIDDSAAVVRKDFPGVCLIQTGRNIGFSAGNNLGYAIASGRYVLFLNPDTIVEKGALDALIDWMDAHPEAGACGPRMTYPDGELQNSSRAFPSFGAGIFRNSFLGRMFPNNPWSRAYLMEDVDRTQEHKADWLSGSALLGRRTALQQVDLGRGPWDETYFMYCEDVDLCYRLNRAGWDRVYVPQATIQHHIGKSSDWQQGAMIRRHHMSMLRFYFKHYAHGWGILMIPVAVVGIFFRAAFAVLKLYRGYAKRGVFKTMVKRKLEGR